MARPSKLTAAQLAFLEKILTDWTKQKRDAGYQGGAFPKTLQNWRTYSINDIMKDPLFQSPPTNQDGSQLGLILSIFKTIGSPTRETWPEAASFRTPPFDWYNDFEGRAWEDILPHTEPKWRDLIALLVKYSGRLTAEKVGSLASLDLGRG